jgi:hypothetical protein
MTVFTAIEVLTSSLASSKILDEKARETLKQCLQIPVARI